MHPVTKAAGSNPATHVLPRFFLDFSEPFGPMNFHSWVILYCMSISTKDKVHSYEFSLMGNLDFATIPSKNRPVNIRGELLTQITMGYLSYFLSPARLIGFSREFSNFSSPHATGDMHRNFQLEIWERPSLYRFI